MKKKLLALSLVLVLLISFSGVVSVQAKTEHEEKLYIDLGILPPKKTVGLIKPVLSREQFAKILINMQSLEGLTAPQTDLSQDVLTSKYRAEIDFCLKNGILLLNENGEFSPNSAVTYKDAVRAMVEVAGYGVLVGNKGNDNEYLSIATKLGILKGVNVKNAEKLTYDELYKIVVNTMQINLPLSENISIESAETLYDRLKVTEHVGILLANSRTSAGVERTSINSVNIDGDIFRTKLDVVNELVGVEVVYYLYQDEVVSISAKSKQEIIELQPSNIEGITDSGSYITLRTNIEPEKIKIEKSALAIVNNKAMAPTAKLFKSFKEGIVKLIDSGNNGSYDVLHMDVAKTIILDSMSLDSFALRAKHSNELVKLYKAKKNLEVYKNGKVIDFSQIPIGSSVSIVCDAFSFDSNGEIVYDYNNITWAKLYVSEVRLTGVVDSKDEEYMFIDDIDYITAHSFKKLVLNKYVSEPKLGDFIEATINYWGNISDAEIKREESGLDYGYLIFAATSDKGLSDELMLKLMNSKGQIGIYTVSDKLVIDGISYKDKKPDDILKNFLIKIKVKETDASGNTTEKEKEVIKRQVISFRLSDDGKIKGIETPAGALTEDKQFDPYKDGQNKLRVRNAVFDKKVAIGTDCFVFVDGAGLGVDNPEHHNFSVRSGKNFGGSSYQFMALYDTDDMGIAKCGAIWNGYKKTGPELGESTRNSLDYQTKSYMIEKIRGDFDKEGNKYYKIILANNNGKKTYNTVRADELFAYSITDVNDWILGDERSNTEYLDLDRVDAEDLTSKFKPGDIVRFTTGDGGINYIERIFAFSEVKNTTVPITGTSGTHMIFANLLKTSDSVFMYQNPQNTENELFGTIGYTSVAVYDMKNEEIKVISGLKLAPSFSSGDDVKVWMRDYDGGGVQEYFLYQY